ncbi:uncharacterized protein BXZ73DRAFT_48097 [Epithele typhae]|uniref:uncharacterized protein n=1 Tax=Epithele typhae TaxID=378194 RepID=UPI0020088812|nr:uncharacterized protein BXZ73DRAFT_48097 [Epithele typhae]KAH9929500.1 hypothetical protein BXZ73DRAFT_48097 [Epithele typhae]
MPARTQPYAFHRPSPASIQPTLDSLPAEILLEIANYLKSREDVLQLSRVSASIFAKVLPALYSDVELHGVIQCGRTLAMLECRPDVARHIRRLAVHPEDDVSPRAHGSTLRAWDNAGVVSRAIVKVAKHLDALSHFDWVGEDMLPDDRMWSELRLRCPRLAHIGTTFGCFLPRPGTSLLQFTGLTGFSLALKDGFYAHSLHLPSRESEPVFTRLWDMLVLRCPDLETLRIVGNSTEPGDVTRLYGAHWPKLRHLCLSALVWNTTPLGHLPQAPDLKVFLERHEGIETLHLLGRPHTNLIDLSTLSIDALPSLKEFSGSFSHLRMLVDRQPPPPDPNAQPPIPPLVHPPVQNALPNMNPALPPVDTPLAKTLERVSFPHAMHLRDLTPLAVSRVLVGLHSLTSIKATFSIQGGYDSNGVFRTIVSSCPHLLDLDITCTTRPSFFLDAFANSLRGLSRLRSLSLALVRMPGEEPMHLGAARIALANPRLKTFSIAFIPIHAHDAQDAAESALECGTFELTSDPHGIPVCLHVVQKRARCWPWQRAAGVGPAAGLAECEGGRDRVAVRRWVHDLRPSGHPDVRQKGLGELFVERSPAGEEARLMVFCLGLLGLTVWALASKALRP